MKRATLAVLGLALLVAMASAAVLVLVGYNGTFSTYDVVYANVPASGNGISAGSPVVYRDVTVGDVASLGRQVGQGVVRAALHITPDELHAIPEGVRADVGITTVFGTQGITLVPPAHIGPESIRVGQTVQSVSRSDTTTLEGDVTDIDNILNALRPASLDAALTSLATALKGNGRSLGDTIANIASYLQTNLPLLPVLEKDVDLGAPAASDLAKDAPPLVSAIGNGAVTANTITQHAATLHSLLTEAVPLSNHLTSLLGSIETPFSQLVANSALLLGDVAANPKELSQIVNGLDDFSKGFAAAERKGPYLSFSGDVDVAAAAQLVLAALGVPGSNLLVMQGLGQSNFNPPTYSAADCPRYGSLSGPNCPGAAAHETASHETAPATTNGPLILTPAEVRAAAEVVDALAGRHPTRSVPSLDALLLGPLLHAMVGQG
jgi:phospholipid/cholesterol/gamma-HCH transport system substrate-binding protein